MGALIRLRLTKQISSVLEIPIKDATFWVDSKNVLYWIQGRSRNYKPFVSHRVGEIHDGSSPEQWKYVSTKFNPADFGTRGLSVRELKESQQWLVGLDFRKKSDKEWPDQNVEIKGNAEISKEMKIEARKRENVIPTNEQAASYVMENQQNPQNRLNAVRYSKWYRVNEDKLLEFRLSVVRVHCWVYRYINNCSRTQSEHITGELTVDELRQTEVKIIQKAQYEVYSEEIEASKKKKDLPKRSSILTFTPILMDGLLRSNTRLRYSDNLPNSVKYPVILPKKHPVTIQIIKYHHEREGHEMGLNHTLNHLRENYVIVHAREMVKRVLKDCMECKRRFRRQTCHTTNSPSSTYSTGSYHETIYELRGRLCWSLFDGTRSW